MNETLPQPTTEPRVPGLRIDRADLRDTRDAHDYRRQLGLYAVDKMGGGVPLPAATLQRVSDDLAKLPHAHVYLARMDGVAVGFSTCFGGYSTFRGAPLWNIHDIAVQPEFRGYGIGRALLQHIAHQARAAGCCKLTLEVREDNPVATGLYHAQGFSAASVGAREVQYLFLEKSL